MTTEQLDRAIERIRQRAVLDAKRRYPKKHTMADLDEAIVYAVGQNIGYSNEEEIQLINNYVDSFNKARATRDVAGIVG